MTRFGSYTLKQLLGEGGYARVFLGARPGGSLVALKVLKEGYQHDASVRKSFLREAELHRSLKHDGIITCRGIEKDGGNLAIVLDYFKSETFKAYVGRTKDLEKILGVLLRVGAALSYLQAKRVVHLDLKPGNILVGTEQRVKLIDFCLSFKVNWITRLLRRVRRRAIPGSPSYLAPEVIEGKVPGFGADMYSLGVITYYGVTGELPFHGASVAEILHKQTHSIPVAPTKLNPSIPEALEVLIFRLLVKDPAHRMSSAERYCEEVRKLGLTARAAPCAV